MYICLHKILNPLFNHWYRRKSTNLYATQPSKETKIKLCRILKERLLFLNSQFVTKSLKRNQQKGSQSAGTDWCTVSGWRRLPGVSHNAALIALVLCICNSCHSVPISSVTAALLSPPLIIRARLTYIQTLSA